MIAECVFKTMKIMFKKITKLCLLLLLASLPAGAQNIFVTVLEEATGTPLSFVPVNIFSDNNPQVGQSVLTNDAGQAENQQACEQGPGPARMPCRRPRHGRLRQPEFARSALGGVTTAGEADRDGERRALTTVVGGVRHLGGARERPIGGAVGGDVERQAGLVGEGDTGGHAAGMAGVGGDRSIAGDARHPDRVRVRVRDPDLHVAAGARVEGRRSAGRDVDGRELLGGLRLRVTGAAAAGRPGRVDEAGGGERNKRQAGADRASLREHWVLLGSGYLTGARSFFPQSSRLPRPISTNVVMNLSDAAP